MGHKSWLILNSSCDREATLKRIWFLYILRSCIWSIQLFWFWFYSACLGAFLVRHSLKKSRFLRRVLNPFQLLLSTKTLKTLQLWIYNSFDSSFFCPPISENFTEVRFDKAFDVFEEDSLWFNWSFVTDCVYNTNPKYFIESCKQCEKLGLQNSSTFEANFWHVINFCFQTIKIQTVLSWKYMRESSPEWIFS